MAPAASLCFCARPSLCCYVPAIPGAGGDCVGMRAWVCVCRCPCTGVCAWVCVCRCACTGVRAWLCVCRCVCTSIRVQVCMHGCACMTADPLSPLPFSSGGPVWPGLTLKRLLPEQNREREGGCASSERVAPTQPTSLRGSSPSVTPQYPHLCRSLKLEKHTGVPYLAVPGRGRGLICPHFRVRLFHVSPCGRSGQGQV